MDKLKIAVCDDEAVVLDMFSQLIAKCFTYHNVITQIEKFTNPAALKRAVGERGFDLLFLDIDMPKIDGITLAKSLRQEGSKIDIVYISSREELVFKVFDVQPYSFIRKSNFFDEIAGVVRSYVAYRKSSEEHRLVVAQGQGEVVVIDLNKTLYFESSGKFQKAFQFRQIEPVTIRYKLRELEERLSKSGFIRVHKGFLVNYQYIKSIGSNEILLTTGGTVPVSRRSVSDVMDRYPSLMDREGNIIG